MTKQKHFNPLIKSSVIYIIATIIGQGMTFLGIVLFTRMMPKAAYGDYSTYYAFVSMFTVIIGANLYYALNNAYIDKESDIIEFRKSVLALSTVIMFFTVLVALVVGAVWLEVFSPFMIIMASIHSYGFFVVNYRIYSANMENDYRKKMWLLILPNTLQLVFALLLILIFPNMSFEARVIGSSIGVVSVALIAYAEIMHFRGKLYNAEYWKYALSISVPSIIMSLSYMIMQQCDRVMITKICSSEDTAVYSAIYYLGYIIAAVDQAAAPVRQAWIFRRLDSKDIKAASIVQKWYLLISGLIATGIVFVGPELVKLFIPESYWEFGYIIPFVLSACMMILYRFYSEIILFYKKNSVLSLCVCVCALINIGLNLWLIPIYGAVAACYTTVAAYVILFILFGVIAGKLSGRIYKPWYFVVFVVWLGILMVLFTVFEDIVPARYLALFVFCLLFGGYLMKNRKEVKGILLEK